MLIYVIVGIAAAGIGLLAGYLIRKTVAEAQIRSAEDEAKRIVAQAAKEAEGKKKEAIIEAREDVHRLRAELER